MSVLDRRATPNHERFIAQRPLDARRGLWHGLMKPRDDIGQLTGPS